MMNDIINLITSTLLSGIKDNIAIAIEISVIAFICAVYKGFEISGGTGKEITRSAFLVEYAIIAALLCTSIVTINNTASSAIDKMVGTMNGISPVLLTISAYTGNVAETAGIGGSFLIATEIVSNVIKLFFLPASIIIAVLALVDNLSEKISITNFINLLKNIVIWGLGLIMTAYIGILSVQSIVAGVSDTALKKTVKFAAGSMIPFVGQYLADSVDAVSASAMTGTSVAGAGAMITIITVTVAPALKILIIAGLLKLASAIIQPVTDSRITNSINQTATAFSLVSGLTIICAVIFTITVGILLNTASKVMGG